MRRRCRRRRNRRYKTILKISKFASLLLIPSSQFSHLLQKNCIFENAKLAAEMTFGLFGNSPSLIFQKDPMNPTPVPLGGDGANLGCCVVTYER